MKEKGDELILWGTISKLWDNVYELRDRVAEIEKGGKA